MSFLSEPITLQSLFGKKRTIGGINVQVVTNETTNDTLTITKQPVQQGASIVDHAFKEPTVFTATLLFKDNLITSLSTIYQSLLDLQNSREPFDIVTPKRIYHSMLMATLSQVTDKATENTLAITLTCQQVIIVQVATVQLDPSKLKFPGSNRATQNSGQKQSALSTLFGAK